MNIKTGLKAAKTVVTSKAGRTILKGQKNSPTILFAAGTVGVVTSTVLACRATLKLEDALSEHSLNEGKARDTRELVRLGEDIDYTEKDFKKDLAVLKVRKIAAAGKVYALPIGVGTLSVCALGFSHVILTRRNAGLMAAYAALDLGFREYRGRVVDELGVEKDREFRFGYEHVELCEIDEVTGTETKKTVRAIPEGQPSIYARFFDRSCSSFKNHPDHDLSFLLGQQAYHNDQLNARGHVFLNEVYDDLGLPRTRAGAQVGWVKGHGDGIIDLGLFDDRNRGDDAFASPRDGAILIDPNVHGVILDLL